MICSSSTQTSSVASVTYTQYAPEKLKSDNNFKMYLKKGILKCTGCNENRALLTLTLAELASCGRERLKGTRQ